MSTHPVASSVLPSSPSRGAGRPRPRLLRWLIGLLILTGVTYGGYSLWVGEIRNMIWPRNWGVVEPGKLYRSAQISRRIIRPTLQDNHIGVVIFMSGDDPAREDTTIEARTCADLGIKRLNFNLNGNGTGKVDKYISALAEIIKSNRRNVPVLVHCETGAQRTGGVVAFYRVLVEGRSGSEAYAELLQYGHDPAKNPHLVPYLNQHMGEVADALAKEKLIDHVPSPLPVIKP
jgi:protein tyrosine/serine phosphatase